MNVDNTIRDDRRSTRVSQAPGGKTSINLFGGDHDEKLLGSEQQHKEENVAPKPTERAAPGYKEMDNSKENATPQEHEGSMARPKEPVPTGEMVEPPSNTELSSNNFASGGHQNSGNYITGRPTSRRIQPPGGSSSIVLG
eukprot:gb/GECG01002769.1/.p1 GENE.gb/GECG01002769.1/~~gb/GECG01002769.1/.p1  ORF type:complete len:140 (+),score=25.82 gb/GECG01002769.1/:1-420(+)